MAVPTTTEDLDRDDRDLAERLRIDGGVAREALSLKCVSDLERTELTALSRCSELAS